MNNSKEYKLDIVHGEKVGDDHVRLNMLAYAALNTLAKRRDEQGRVWLHFVDWSQLLDVDLPWLESAGLVVDVTIEPNTEGVNRFFPQRAYRLTAKGEDALKQPILKD